MYTYTGYYKFASWKQNMKKRLRARTKMKVKKRDHERIVTWNNCDGACVSRNKGENNYVKTNRRGITYCSISQIPHAASQHRRMTDYLGNVFEVAIRKVCRSICHREFPVFVCVRTVRLFLICQIFFTMDLYHLEWVTQILLSFVIYNWFKIERYVFNFPSSSLYTILPYKKKLKPLLTHIYA